MYNRLKLLTIKIKHMKKIFTFIVLLSLTGCVATEGIVRVEQPICRQDADCTNYGIHDHVFFTW